MAVQIEVTQPSGQEDEITLIFVHPSEIETQSCKHGPTRLIAIDTYREAKGVACLDCVVELAQQYPELTLEIAGEEWRKRKQFRTAYYNPFTNLDKDLLEFNEQLAPFGMEIKREVIELD